MSTISSLCRSVVVQRSGLLRRCLAAVILLPVMLSAGTVRAQDCTREMREAAQAWAMSKIAVIQAAAGDVQGAKRTVSQIDEEGEKGPSDVIAVWFCNGQPIYNHPPRYAGWIRYDRQENGHPFSRDWSVNHVPSTVPPGLPANYLASDPRHGALANFTDEYDSYGTRVTSRKYADGYVVIETPYADQPSQVTEPISPSATN
jgi:hypothetical protein